MRKLRDSLGESARLEADARIMAQVVAHPAYDAADAVFTYLSMGTEVDTRAIIHDAWRRGKQVAIPRVVPGTRSMDWYAIDGFAGLETSAFGVEEPMADPLRAVSVPCGGAGHAVALVPGLTFDASGYRIGYGGGFYDAFLPAFGGVSLGLCRLQQFSEEPLPHDDHDVAVDEVVCG